MRFLWEAPFSNAPKSFFKTKQRYEDVSWTNDHYAIVSEGWYDTRNTKSFLVDLNNGESKVIDDRNYQDVYSDPEISTPQKTSTEDTLST
jgi:hypothetical protein